MCAKPLNENTYHAQTAKFLAMVATSMPAISTETMQGWIQNPRALDRALRTALISMPPKVTFASERTKKFLTLVESFMPELHDSVIQHWVENPDVMAAALRSALTMPLPFKVWRTIKSDVECESPRDSKEAENVAAPQGNNELDLVVVTVQELTGYSQTFRGSWIHDRARTLGLEMCPRWVGPKLRRLLADQPKDEWLAEGMEPITCEDGRIFFGFYKRDWYRGCKPEPDGWGGYDECSWHPDERFVFVLPRK